MERFELSLDPSLRRLLLSQATGGTGIEPGGAPSAIQALALVPDDHPPDGFDDLHWSRLAQNIFLVALAPGRLEPLARAPGVKYLEAGRAMGPILEGTIVQGGNGTSGAQRSGSSGPAGHGVVVGVIEAGLDFTNGHLRRADGTTRIAHLWDQTLTASVDETAPAGFGFGVEYDGAAIDAALETADPFARVRHRPSPGSPGTPIARAAASEASGALLVHVQPRLSPGDPSCTSTTAFAAAVAYIFAKADALGLPCVITSCLGSSGGSHDGESLFERVLDRQLEDAGRALVVAAGHELVWRGHASGRLAEGMPAVLDWSTGGWPRAAARGSGEEAEAGRPKPHRMEIWYSSRDRFRIRLANRDGQATNWVAPGESGLFGLEGYQLFIASERFSPLNGESRIYLELAASQPRGSTGGDSWRIELDAIEARDGRFDAFIERSRRDPGNAFADQSLFEVSSFDPAVTLGAPATCRRAITVADGGEATVRGQPGVFASRGRTRDGRGKPDLAAPGGVLVAAPRGGNLSDPLRRALPPGLGLLQASLAAPRVAGLVACLLESRPDMSAAEIRCRLIAATTAPAGVEGFDPAWGYGLLDAEALLRLD